LRTKWRYPKEDIRDLVKRKEEPIGKQQRQQLLNAQIVISPSYHTGLAPTADTTKAVQYFFHESPDLPAGYFATFYVPMCMKS